MVICRIFESLTNFNIMKNIVMSLCFLTNFIFAQDLVTDIDGNTYEYLTYGTQEWVLENAEMVTYRDGTPIPQVVSDSEWTSLTTGAWCYYNNDETKGKLYNWYAVVGIHDAASLSNPSQRKGFAPEGWHVPSDAEWTTLEEYLIAMGYNYDGTTTDVNTGNKIAKAMASTTGWESSTYTGAIGNDQSLNNLSGFNAFPEGYRFDYGSFDWEGLNAFFWSSTESFFNDLTPNTNLAWYRYLDFDYSLLLKYDPPKRFGFSVRFVRDTNTASVGDYNLKISIYPNPVSSTLFIDNDAITTVKIVDLQGRMLIETNSKQIDVSSLTNGTYLVNLYDDHKHLQTLKVIKR